QPSYRIRLGHTMAGRSSSTLERERAIASLLACPNAGCSMRLSVTRDNSVRGCVGPRVIQWASSPHSSCPCWTHLTDLNMSSWEILQEISTALKEGDRPE